MSRSIVTDDMECCLLCGRPRQNVHHVFFGTANRKISDKHGFVIPLCVDHHIGRNGVHFNKSLDLKIKQHCQRKYEALGHSREEFIKLIGRSYL